MTVWGEEWGVPLSFGHSIWTVFFLSLRVSEWWGAFYLEENYFRAQLSVLLGKLWLPYKRGLPVSLCPRLGRPPGQ